MRRGATSLITMETGILIQVTGVPIVMVIVGGLVRNRDGLILRKVCENRNRNVRSLIQELAFIRENRSSLILELHQLNNQG